MGSPPPPVSWIGTPMSGCAAKAAMLPPRATWRCIAEPMLVAERLLSAEPLPRTPAPVAAWLALRAYGLPAAAVALCAGPLVRCTSSFGVACMGIARGAFETMGLANGALIAAYPSSSSSISASASRSLVSSSDRGVLFTSTGDGSGGLPVAAAGCSKDTAAVSRFRGFGAG